MADIPDNRFDDLRADHLAEEVREVADLNRRIADLQRQLQQAQEERDNAFGWAEATNQRSLRVLEDARRSAAERDAAIKRAGAAEALVDRIDKIIAAPNERPAATKGYLAWAGLLTDVRLEIHKARKSAPAEARVQQKEGSDE